MISLKSISASQKAFTLLELLLVTFIMAAAAAAALPNFARFVDTIEFKRSADDLVSAIRFGQLRALTRGKWVQVKVEPSGYWLEEERFFNDRAINGLAKPVFERLKNRHGRVAKFPDGVTLQPTQAVVVLSPDGRIKSPKLQICRRDECLVIEASRVIGQLRVVNSKEGVTDERS